MSHPWPILPSSYSLCTKPLVTIPTNWRRTFACSVPAHARPPSSIARRLPDADQDHNRLRDFNLQGKVFVVTGGGRGLGLTLAEVLVEAGGTGISKLLSKANLPLTTLGSPLP